MFRIGRVALCAVAAAAVSGCIQSSTLIKMKPDGSGTIEQTMTMNADAVAQFSALAAMGDDKNKTKGSIDDLFSEKDARAAAAKMGQGVTFVSSQKIDTPDHKGIKATYAFTDIRKITIEDMNTPSNASDPGGGAPQAPKDPPMKFDFKELPGGHALLTILQPGVDKAMNAAPSSKPNASVDPKMAEQGFAMMKMFMKGLKVDVAVQVPHVVKTSSQYVDGGTVTLLSMDFDTILADPAMAEKLNNATSLSDTKALLKDFKGVKVNLDPQVTIEFSGK
jgi:hypothetical protein